MRTYTTTLGDTWDLIAYRLYGAERYMKDLMEANMPLSDTLVFSGGTVINTPEIGTTVTTDDLPFWHSGDNSIWLQE